MNAVVVVTGASGFIGRATTRALADDGAHVIAVSRSDIATLDDLRGNWETIRVGDYSETPAPMGAVLIHAAERADIAEAAAMGERHKQEMDRLLHSLLAHDWTRVVYLSSGNVYGIDDSAPRRPGAPLNLKNTYCRAKAAAERHIRTLPGGVVARLSNIYGPPVPAGTVLGDILAQIPGKGPLIVRNPRPARDFLWIDDVARALSAMAIGTATGLYNLGTGIATSVGDLAQTALTLAGEGDRPVVARDPGSESSPTDTIALDISATTAAFGWRPEVPLVEGLSRLMGEPK